MPFQSGQSGNPNGRVKGQQTAATLHREVRRSAIRTLGEHAPELLELGVARARAGNAEALAGCLSILAVLIGDEPTKKPCNASAKNSHQDGRGATS
jgi:hypothetical protein